MKSINIMTPTTKISTTMRS